MRSTKTDNGNLPSKLALRRHFLRTYHADKPPNVFECCQGGGVLWDNLAVDFKLGYRWGVDLKPKKGRVKIDSTRVLAQPGWDFDVIDIDTYGSPWSHWCEMLPHVVRPTTVFLTIGHVRMGGGGVVNHHLLEAIGVASLDLPPSLASQLIDIGQNYVLNLTGQFGLQISSAKEAPPGRTARYIGIRLNPGLKIHKSFIDK